MDRVIVGSSSSLASCLSHCRCPWPLEVEKQQYVVIIYTILQQLRMQPDAVVAWVVVFVSIAGHACTPKIFTVIQRPISSIPAALYVRTCWRPCLMESNKRGRVQCYSISISELFHIQFHGRRRLCLLQCALCCAVSMCTVHAVCALFEWLVTIAKHAMQGTQGGGWRSQARRSWTMGSKQHSRQLARHARTGTEWACTVSVSASVPSRPNPQSQVPTTQLLVHKQQGRICMHAWSQEQRWEWIMDGLVGTFCSSIQSRHGYTYTMLRSAGAGLKIEVLLSSCMSSNGSDRRRPPHPSQITASIMWQQATTHVHTQSCLASLGTLYST